MFRYQVYKIEIDQKFGVMERIYAEVDTYEEALNRSKGIEVRDGITPLIRKIDLKE